MGKFYKACNQELDRAYHEALVTPADQMLAVPWLPGKGLLSAGRLGLISAQDAGIGLAKFGRDYKFYYSRKFAGWWGFEAWGLAKTAIFAFIWLLMLSSLIREFAAPTFHPGMALSGAVPYKALLLGIAGLALFGVRGLFCFRHAKISLASGSTISMAPACINFALLVLSIAIMYKGYHTIGVDFIAVKSASGGYAVAQGSLLGALAAIVVDIFGFFGQLFSGDVAGQVWLGLFLVPFGLAAGAWFVMNAGFWPMAAKIMFKELNAAHGHRPVVAAVYNDSDFARVVNIQGIGVLLMLATYSVTLFASAKMIAL